MMQSNIQNYLGYSAIQFCYMLLKMFWPHLKLVFSDFQESSFFPTVFFFPVNKDICLFGILSSTYLPTFIPQGAVW